MPLTADYFMTFGWDPTFTQLPDGDWRLTVPLLSDFELFASARAELEKDWRDALHSHLSGYLAVGKSIPLPGITVQAYPETLSSTWAMAAAA
jgi:hypothetical protein